MKLKKNIILTGIVVASIASSSVYAQAGGRTALAKITRVFATASGDTLVSISNNQLTNGAVCSPQSRYSIPASGANARSGLATVLTARALSADVQFDVSACTAVGAESPVISNVILMGE